MEVFTDDVTPPTGTVVLWRGGRPTRQAIGGGWGAVEVSCTSPKNCVAIPDDLSTGWAVWNGSGWTVHESALLDEHGLTCATANLCLAAGIYDGTVVRFTGTSWVVEDSLPSSTVSCVSTALCLAFGSDGVTRRFTGSGWVVAPTPPVGGSLSCSRPTRCTDVGFSSYSRYDGRQWSVPAAMPAAPIRGRLSCTRASFCAAADGNQLAQFRRGRWSRVSTVADDPAPLKQVSCATRRSCVGVDTYVAHQFDRSGETGQAKLGLAMEPPSTITGISCVTTTFCVATTGQRMQSDVLHVFDGSGWRSVTTPDYFIYLEAVSCSSLRFCAAVGFTDGGNGEEAGVAALYDGSTWRFVSAPHLTRVSCVTAASCLGTGEIDGRPVSSEFDGSGWSAPAAVGDVTGAAVVSLSCVAHRRCVAVDTEGRAAAYRQGHWSSFAGVPGAGPLVAVSCSGPRTCLAVSSTGFVVRRRGASWSRPQHLTGLAAPSGISCSSSTACVVVDDTGRAVFGRRQTRS